MAERPILFSAPMVRAILAGEKTQTRRMLNPQPQEHHWQGLPGHRQDVRLVETSTGLSARCSHWLGEREEPNHQWVRCRYGRPGDRLWVRETWCEVPASARPERHHPADTSRGVRYFATWTGAGASLWKPSIHMPRWASRLTLEVMDVRVERLQAITQADALAEGAVDTRGAFEGLTDTSRAGPRGGFEAIWNAVNGPESWDANPWVWAVSFRRVVDAAR